MVFGVQACANRFDTSIHQMNQTSQSTSHNAKPALNETPSETAARCPEEIINRKTMALARLAHIEKMTAGFPSTLTERFRCTAAVCCFDPKVFLQKYQTNEKASKLCTFMGWASVPLDQNRTQFKEIIAKHDVESPLNEQYAAIKDLLKNFVAYFDLRFRYIDSEEAEEALKGQFLQVYDDIIDANNSNCVQVMRIRLEQLALNVFASDIPTSFPSETIRAQAGLALYNYRDELLNKILITQNPGEPNMVELKQIAAERLNEALGLKARVQFGGSISSAERRHAQDAVYVFLNAYRPEQFLLEGLRTCSSTIRPLRNSMLLWANQYYDLNNEDPRAAKRQPHDMDRRLSESEESIEELSAGEGGNLSLVATMLLMEKLGLVNEVYSYPLNFII